MVLGTFEYAISLLIIDDDSGSLELFADALAQPGLEILTTSNPKKGLDLFCNRRPKIVLTELVMPHISGMELLERCMAIEPASHVIVMTAHYSTETAVEAIKKGASDYLNKPVSIGPLRERIGKLVEEARKPERSLQIEDEFRTNSGFEGIVGRSTQMCEMFARIRCVAPHYRSALIIGETGTGKDLVARALHRLSPVASGPSWCSIAPLWWRRCSKASCLDTLRAPSLERPRINWACSNTPTEARCS